MFSVIHPLTWAEFDRAVQILAAQVDKERIKAIYGNPRGGLTLAVALSHHLDLPMLSVSGECIAWVDDIIETGRELERAKPFFGQHLAWVGRKDREDCITAQIIPDGWILFPWESMDKAKKDSEEYEISRKRNI